MSEETVPEPEAELASTEAVEPDLPPDSAPKRRKPQRRKPAEVPSTPGRGLLVAAAAIGLVAGLIGGGVVAGFWHPTWGASGKYTGQQVNDAKRDLCSAALLARQAVAKNMHLSNPDPENPVAQMAVAANARLALAGSASYLRGRLADVPAASADLARTVGAVAAALERLDISYLAGQPNGDREQVAHDLEARINELGKLCQ